MKPKFFLILLIISTLATACSSSNQTLEADAYCDSVITIQDEVIVQLDSFFQSLRFRQFDTEEFYEKAVAATNRNILILKKLGAYDEDFSLNYGSLSVLNEVDNILQHEGKKMVELDQQLLQNYDPKLVSELEELEYSAILRIQAQQMAFDSIQVDFLESYGFDLEVDTIIYDLKTDADEM